MYLLSCHSFPWYIISLRLVSLHILAAINFISPKNATRQSIFIALFLPCSGKHTSVRWLWAGHVTQNVAQPPHHQALTNQASPCPLFIQMGQFNRWHSISAIPLCRVEHKYSSSPAYSIKKLLKNVEYLLSAPLNVFEAWKDKLLEEHVSVQCQKSKLRLVNKIWDYLILYFTGNMNKYFPFITSFSQEFFLRYTCTYVYVYGCFHSDIQV